MKKLIAVLITAAFAGAALNAAAQAPNATPATQAATPAQPGKAGPSRLFAFMAFPSRFADGIQSRARPRPGATLEFPGLRPHLGADFHRTETENMKRIFLFIATNLAVVVLLTIVLSALGVDRFLTENGLDLQMLLAFSLIVGFSGSIFSLLISKPMAKWSTGARVIEQPEGAH